MNHRNQLGHSASQSATVASAELAGSLPIFPAQPGSTLVDSLSFANFRQKRLIFNQLVSPGQVHVYSADCRAGDRLRAQSFIPVLPMGSGVAPTFAVVAQSLPYSADLQNLPLELPAGYSAVVAPSPRELHMPVRDVLTRVGYYPGPAVDTRTLVGGRCYIIVWHPQNQMGKYVLQVGHSWPLRWTYWAQIPYFWWQIRGWFDASRTAAYLAGGGLLLTALALFFALRRRVKRNA